MEIIKVKDYEEMSEKAANIVIEHMKSLKRPVIGFATGSTPIGLYNCLVKKYQQKEVSFKHATTFNLDEYVGLPKENKNSYHYYMHENLFQHIDIQPENVHIPNGMAEDLEQECMTYDRLISKNKIDIQILGLGLNGHIGFNEPGTSFKSRTHIVKLDQSTRKANARFFQSIDEVPTKAITMGIETIMESKKILLLVSGKKKADALARLLGNSDISEEFPASILRQHNDVTVIADEEALKKINE
ncbi:glucosamine-6-phosphate deaminase [Bacillaceae bacterium ZC4]|uniref:glucosamine-6-phosphate deaminase n=1 Tax=Aeribacillus TaxID=1055323 RepID=UPI000E3A4DB9|nr:MULTISPECIES: glucosamine-6-phosphate deaminase [Aeribacillus]AXI38311.1 glucosamine-6-phosphate deaminase [Bacillaceae bacterium ZC4]MED1443636.1 glucosamine-6-phosphate deaminase [Aeribacillus composti]REJ23001.1 MAG: glucosamine-6-phosphate deaminase [Bacillaceae bacterium]RZI51439.1 glucosamine-6-phosphate deaminase [Aeribacillus pallidus]